MLFARTGSRREHNVYYVCDRKKCNPCVKDYHWTPDVNHALYSTHIEFDYCGDAGIYEVIRKS